MSACATNAPTGRPAAGGPGVEPRRHAPAEILDYARTHSVAATCRHFGIARSTYYRWATRYDPQRLSVLENRSCAPWRVRRPDLDTAASRGGAPGAGALPTLGQGQARRGAAPTGIDPLRLHDRAHPARPETWWGLGRAESRTATPHSRHARPYAIRKPKEHSVTAPGDLVQLDTMHLTAAGGGATPLQRGGSDLPLERDRGARASLPPAPPPPSSMRCKTGCPFPVRAIQVDGGSEFMAAFEAACQERGITLFVLPPRSPKLNGHVERIDGTHRSEFWELYDGPTRIAAAASGAAGVGGDVQSSPAPPSPGLPHPRRAPRRARHPAGVADVART